jgi:hypothetical protein
VAESQDDVRRDFDDVVNMTPKELEHWRPKDDKEHSKWRYSLMNWGHDPLKEG